MKILVTGASGFIGRWIIKNWQTAQDEMLPLGGYRDLQAGSRHFGQSLTPVLVQHKPDVVIHCAFQKYDPSGLINYEGSKQWLKECRDAGIVRQIFISSVSASEQPFSNYGKYKLKLEKLSRSLNGISVRLGLVVGDGGVFATMCNLIQSFHFFPLLNRGRTEIFPIHIKQVVEAVEYLVHHYESFQGQTMSLYEDFGINMRLLLREIADKMGAFLIAPAVPYFVMAPMVKASSMVLGKQAPITIDNLKGLSHSKKPEHDSALEVLKIQRIDLEEMIRLGVAANHQPRKPR